jgi:hypothetical protein
VRAMRKRASLFLVLISFPLASSAAADEPKPAIELTTLRILRDKQIITPDEYDSAIKDIGDTSGARAPDSNTLVIGKWATTIYGFVEADQIYDSTQSLGESSGNAQIARAGTYGGDNDRVTFTIRNSRIGFRSKAPEYAGIRASAQIEMDFLGTQLPIGTGQPYLGSEGANFTNATLRARHAFLKMETPIVDVLFGQTWQLYGWQSAYHPNTVQIQGVPGQIYSRTAQVRVSKTIKTEAVTFEAAIAAMRPPQRDAAVPEGQAGLRLAFNGWTGVQTVGSTATQIAPLSIAVTGDLRRVRVPEFTSAPKESKDRAASAVAVDAFIPVVPATKDSMGNSLALNAEASTGYGVADLYTGLSGGVANPTLANPTNVNPAPTYTPDVDPSIAVYDADGVLHFIQWTSVLVGVQYYLPGADGKVWVSANYSHLQSANTKNYGAAAKARDSLDWFDVNLFADATAALRFGLEYANFNDRYVDGTHAINHRLQLSGFYLF